MSRRSHEASAGDPTLAKQSQQSRDQHSSIAKQPNNELSKSICRARANPARTNKPAKKHEVMTPAAEAADPNSSEPMTTTVGSSYDHFLPLTSSSPLQLSSPTVAILPNNQTAITQQSIAAPPPSYCIANSYREQTTAARKGTQLA